ncbi:TetR/AcrR family transcriptional regulator [Levilactobacillus cerevisiae]|uniref:TetR/AcrR family transcriptional regulator n=1 Tax=Levilactobacillus cerevisiae TaxID=1704076 RepID=UPI0013DE2A37|nr:TetR/AcrR family transcriptional regulator [Levilactobacillus cerevisiae]
MKKNPELTAATRQTLIDAFCQLCPAKPVSKITVRELTTRAGYNRSTFYQYFPDVYALLEAIEDRVIAEIMANLTANLQKETLAENFIGAFVVLHERMATYYDVVLASGNNAAFTDRLKRAIANKLMALYELPTDDQQVAYVTDFYLSGVIAILYRWIGNKRDLPVTELATLIRQLIVAGVGSQLSMRP